MAEAFVEKLAALEARYVELEASLAREEVYSDPQRMLTVQRELGSQRRVVEAYRRYRQISQSLEEAEEIVSAGEDDELVEMARADLEDLRPRQEEAREEIREMLAADDEESHRDAILEIRAGTGGDEATLFAADLMRMYMRLAERRGWKVEEISMSRSEVGGIKEAVLELTGGRVYGELRFEGGVHRVQRVPATEAQGRIHTSTATIAVLPEAEEVEVELKPEEVRWEAFRASGAGGQHVNRTDSAIRMIHLPTGIKVECQDERSQHKNRVRAEKLLRAKLYQHYLEEQHARRASARKSLVGSGSRSEKIRTYNFPDSRVKDHRINFMIHDVLGMLQGGEALDEMLGALANFEKEQRLAEI